MRWATISAVLLSALLLACSPAATGGSSPGLPKSVHVQHYEFGASLPETTCPIRVDGVSKHCRLSQQRLNGDRLSGIGLFSWPHEGIDGLGCSQAICLAADAQHIDFFVEPRSGMSARADPSTLKHLQGLLVIRDNDNVVAIALTTDGGRDRSWSGALIEALSDETAQDEEAQVASRYLRQAFGNAGH